MPGGSTGPHGSLAPIDRLRFASFRAWLLSPFLLLCGMGLLGRISYEMIRSPLAALYARHIGAPHFVIGVLVAAVTITGIFLKFPAGALADQWGARRIMLVGLLVKATAPFFYIFALTWPLLFGVRLYHGASSALFAPAAAAQIARLYPDQRGSRLGLYDAAEHIGVLIGPLIGAYVLASANFATAFVVAGAFGIATALLILPFPRDPPHWAPRRERGVFDHLAKRLLSTARNPAILLVCFVEATLFAGVGTVQAYVPLYAHSIHLPVMEIGIIGVGQGFASIAARPLVGWAGDRFGRRRFIVLGLLLAAVALCLIPHTSDMASLIGLEAMFGVGASLVTPCSTALVADLVEHNDFGAAMGAFGSLVDIGHAAGPLLAGGLIAWLGYGTGFALVGAMMLLGCVLFIGAHIGARRKPGL